MRLPAAARAACLITCLAALTAGAAAAPAPTASPAPTANPSPTANSVLGRYLLQDIEASSDAELAERCRRLGLSDQGGRDELRRRLMEYYKVDASAAAASAGGVTDSKQAAAPASGQAMDITIESAGSAQYLTVDEVNESYLRLSGGVRLSVDDARRNAKHRISADQIVYNRKTEVMAARGRVDYTLTDKGKDQRFQGSELRFSLNDMEVFMLDGVLHNTRATGGQTLDYRIEGARISRNEDNLIVLDDAAVSSSTASPPAYQVKAAHIWLLRSGEWAILDGVLHLGRVPLLWVPFFYYPGDEMVFNPVAGYQEPEGAYLQTTTYIAGRKTKSKAPLSFMQFGDGDSATRYRLHGLFLEPVVSGQPAAASPSPVGQQSTASPGADMSLFKVMADAYSRYGFLLGVQGKMTVGPVLNADFLAAAGFSRALYKGQSDSDWSTYLLVGGQEAREYWEKGYLFGAELPIRFVADLKAQVRLEGFQAGLALPLSGDPTFRGNFLGSRKEDIDWSKIIGLTKTTAAVGAASAGNDTMNMSLAMSWNPGLTALKPFVESFSLGNLDAGLNWSARSWSNPPEWIAKAKRSADKQFWAPDLLTLPKLGLSLSGTLFQYPWPAAQAPAAGGGKTGAPDGQPAAGDIGPSLLLPGDEYVEPAVSPEPAAGDAGAAEAGQVGAGAEPDGPALAPPALTERSPAGVSLSDWQARLGYSLSPGLTISSRFAASDATTPLDWAQTMSYWTLQDRLSGSLKLNVTSPLSLVSLDGTLNLSGQDQSLLELSGAAPAGIAATVNSETAKARYFTVDNSGVLRVTPLKGTVWFDASSLEYGMTTVWYRYKWESGLTPAKAIYKIQTLDWTKDYISRHYGGVNLSFAAAPFAANLKGEFVLPPLKPSINARAGFQWEKISLSADEGFNLSDDFGTVTPGPLRLSLSMPLADWFSSSHSLEYDVEKDRLASYVASLNLAGFNFGLTARQAADQVYDLASRSWKTGGVEYFRVVNGSIDGTLAWNPDPVWFNRVSTKLSLNGRWNQNFVTVTDSALTWRLDWSFKVAEFLDFDFSINGQNNRMFRYIPAFNRAMGLSEKDDRNFFEDLADSFAFAYWDAGQNALVANDRLRQSSYFKMSGLSAKAVHYLGDWQLSLSYSGTPSVVTTNNVQSIKWVDQFAATVAWYPISELSTTVRSNYDTATNKQKLSIE